MAKIASSKPYGSGKNSTNKTPTRSSPRKADKKVETEQPSPIRMSPRRRKSVSEAIESTEPIAKAKPKKNNPAPPKFSESKRSKTSPKTPKTKTSRRKSIPVQQAEDEKIIDYVQTIYQGDISQGEEEDSHSTSIYKPSDENSPIFEESVSAEPDEDYIESIKESYEEEEEFGNENEDKVEEYDNYQYEDDYDDENEEEDDEFAFHFDEEEEMEDTEGYNSQILDEEYNDRFRYTSNTVRERLAKYFQRRENSSNVSFAVSRAEIWNRMKDWFKESVIPSAKELGEITFDFTKKAIEGISKRLEKRENEEDETYSVQGHGEPQIYEITDDQEDNFDENIDLSDQEMNDNEMKRSKVEEEEKGFDSQHTSYHSIESENQQYMSEENYEKISKTIEPVEVLQSRLTEIILFLAQCTPRTPIQSIFEHLEELFELKAANPLNYTEKQLVAKVIRDFLTESENILEPAGGAIPAFEPVILTSSMNESPKRIKILTESGIRFRAPKFTAEEEALFEEIDRKRKVHVNVNIYSKIGAKSKLLQRKLLAPESVVDLIEGLPENRTRASALNRGKEDSVDAAIEDIIAQKMKEARKKEEDERLETEKLKARVAELEREARERSTKEALLQKQLEEQKKELEIEKAAAKAKLESLKTAPKSTEKKPEIVTTLKSAASKPAVFSSFNFGSSEKPPVSASIASSESSPSKGANSFGFSFGNSSGETKPSEVKASSESTDKAPAFASFSFGANKTEAKPAVFNFGSTVKTGDKATAFSFDAKSEDKPVGLSVKEEEKPALFTGSKTEDKASGLNFGSTSEKSSTFNFGSKTEDKGTKFSMFGGKTEEKAKSSGFSFAQKPEETFSFGSSKAEEGSAKPVTFSFGSEEKPATAPVNPPIFNFSSSTNPFSFGDKEPSQPSQQSQSSAFGNFNSFSTGSNNSTLTSTTTSTSTNLADSSSNPFAALNSAPMTNIFSNSNTFNFGASTSTPVFSFPPMNSSASSAANPIMPMNFGGPSAGNEGAAVDLSFAPGNRQISIPRRKRK